MAADGRPGGRKARASDAALSLRLRFGGPGGLAIGPGKIALLERIRELGSISAAARDMGMAYRRAWLLVRSLNDGFGAEVVETLRGGRERGGARLTPLGDELVARYRRMETEANRATGRDLAALLDAVRTDSRQRTP